MYIISRCLLGCSCKYDGGNNRNEQVIEFCRDRSCVTACPESDGKLPCPRPPAERVGDRVVDREGRDVTDAFREGAQASFRNCVMAAEQRGEKIEGAVLKANSPSCGSGTVYDGTFSGRLIPGDGVFAALLKEKNIPVITEKDTEELSRRLGENIDNRRK